MEASALTYHGAVGLQGRSPLLRLQSDERLIALMRRGNTAAFEVLLSRYESRLIAFCRHLLGSHEDAEDVLQEVMTAAFHAILADDRPINVRPWLYRIARNRSLNHLRRTQAIGVDSMDHHLAEHGASTADKVHARERFRALVDDIQHLPETQRTALVLREMDALSYEQIAEAMETTVSSVKSLLVRARVSLAEAAEARQLSCDEVRLELAEIAEGLRKRPSPLVRRHLKDCQRCAAFRTQLRATNRALAALLPVGPFVLARKLAFLHFGHSAAGAGSSAVGGTAAGSTAAGVAGGAAISGAVGGGGFVSAGLGAVGAKAAAGLAAAAIVTAGAVEVDHHHAIARGTPQSSASPVAAVPQPAAPPAPTAAHAERPSTVLAHAPRIHRAAPVPTPGATHTVLALTKPTDSTSATTTATTPTTSSAATATTPSPTTAAAAPLPGRVQTQTDPTVLPPVPTAPPTPTGATTTPITSVPTAGGGVGGVTALGGGSSTAPGASPTPTASGTTSPSTGAPTAGQAPSATATASPTATATGSLTATVTEPTQTGSVTSSSTSSGSSTATGPSLTSASPGASGTTASGPGTTGPEATGTTAPSVGGVTVAVPSAIGPLPGNP